MSGLNTNLYPQGPLQNEAKRLIYDITQVGNLAQSREDATALIQAETALLITEVETLQPVIDTHIQRDTDFILGTDPANFLGFDEHGYIVGAPNIFPNVFTSFHTLAVLQEGEYLLTVSASVEIVITTEPTAILEDLTFAVGNAPSQYSDFQQTYFAGTSNIFYFCLTVPMLVSPTHPVTDLYLLPNCSTANCELQINGYNFSLVKIAELI